MASVYLKCFHSVNNFYEQKRRRRRKKPVIFAIAKIQQQQQICDKQKAIRSSFWVNFDVDPHFWGYFIRCAMEWIRFDFNVDF